MSEPIPLSAPDITQREIDAVTAVLRSDRLSLGPRLAEFEHAIAQRAGRAFGVGVNSGTSGLHLCLRAMGIGEGDEVITTPFSFIATTGAILMQRAKPVFVDIDPDSYNMDPPAVESAITPRTRAILPVEVFGNTAHFDVYERIARDHNLAMLEDCCEALGGSLQGRSAGSFGDAGVFAFYPNKQITTGEGGMIVTDSEQIRDLCVSMRNQGRGGDDWFSYARLGYNYRLSELAAALGVVQTQRLDEILQKRRQVARWYDERLGDIEDVHLPPMQDRDSASWFVYVVRLSDRFSPADRDAILAGLRNEGVGCNRYFVPIHAQPFVQRATGTKRGDFHQTERIADRTLALPFHANLTPQQVAIACEELVHQIQRR
ncbi:MAG: DegT/DnrJ/EryC1/StrS family aminotransferase [Planctomycetota bacterium]